MRLKLFQGVIGVGIGFLIILLFNVIKSFLMKNIRFLGIFLFVLHFWGFEMSFISSLRLDLLFNLFFELFLQRLIFNFFIK
jgi:hypothetical protein